MVVALSGLFTQPRHGAGVRLTGGGSGTGEPGAKRRKYKYFVIVGKEKSTTSTSLCYYPKNVKSCD